MSSIHYFQRYSQPENVATNNTLLLLSRLYQASPYKFKAFLNDLLDDSDLEAGIQFNQQQRGKGSVPDGSIDQVSFKVVVETKLHKHFSLPQLTEHLNNFGKEQYQVLLSLSPKTPDNSLKSQIEDVIVTFNTNNKTSIKYLPTTFNDIVNKFKQCIEIYDYELNEIIDDYEEYCLHDKLITDEEARMKVVTCGWTLEENMKFNLYYDDANRGYSDHDYLGIYSDKSIKGIGKIENIITTDLLSPGKLNIIDSTMPVTTIQEQNIINVMAAAKINNNWNIETGHKFFCVEKFYPTNFRKTSKYPLQGTKFFNLKNLLNVNTLPPTAEIAQKIEQMEW